MKNKFLKLLTISLLVCATLFTLSACEEKHTHLFDKQVVAEDYFCSAAACEVKAKYYLSCACGEKGSETFEYGNALEHSFTNYVFDDNASYEKDGTKTATCDNGCGKTDTINADGTKLDSKITFKTLSVDGENASAILPNATEEFSFAEEIEIIGIVTFEVALDIYGLQTFSTKIVPLEIGDNTFYVFEMEDDHVNDTFKVTLRRRPNYTVSFNSNGSSTVESQTVEEGLLATKPSDIEKAGYTFDGWDFDFNTPVTQNETINAKWIANTNTPYKVEYYLQNIDDDNYTLEDTENLTGTTDTIANAEIKTFPHFTAEQKSVSGRIHSDGSTVLKVYYTRNYYQVTVQKENDNGTVTGGGNYKYNKTISVKATVNLGYTFNGWYDGNNKVSDDLEYTFNPVNDITLTAKWTVNIDTPYKIEYYLQNLNNSEYTLQINETENLTGKTDTTATAEIKTFPHFTYNQYKSNSSGNINGDGSTVLKVYYTRNYYQITVQKENDNGGTVTGGGSYANAQSITVKAIVNPGYTFNGWYDGNNKVSDSLEFTFNPFNDVVLTAKWIIKQGEFRITLKLECIVRNKNILCSFPDEEDILSLGFIKSDTEENTYFQNFNSGEILDISTPTPLDSSEYKFSAWKYVDGNKKVTVKTGTVINADNFPVLENSNELVLIAQCYALWTPFY